MFEFDFIVDSLGKLEADFQATLKLVKDLEFDLSFVFIYSPRPGTPAANLPDDVTQAEKVRRLEALNEVHEAKMQEINQSMIGTIQKVLVEGESKREGGTLQGRTTNNRLVHLKAVSRLINQIVDIEITQRICFLFSWKCSCERVIGSGSES